MSRIATMFERRAAASRAALIPYLTAGYPRRESTVPLMHALADNGGDLIEVGVPFSDPMADGPVIQAACYEAVESGIGLRDVLDMVAEFRRRNDETPIILMSYCNPILAMGIETFAERAQGVGVDGLLLVDLPPEDGDAVLAALRQRELDTVLLVAPTTPAERCRQICAAASGFVYYVSLKGVTGASHFDADAVGARVRDLKEWTDLPIAVGFGVRDAESATSVARIADGVVIGSALVQRVAGEGDDMARCCADTGEWMATIRAALDAA